MNINGIIWLKNVVQKLLWKHNITTDEVEEVFANAPRFKFQEKEMSAAKISTPPMDVQMPEGI